MFTQFHHRNLTLALPLMFCIACGGASKNQSESALLEPLTPDEIVKQLKEYQRNRDDIDEEQRSYSYDYCRISGSVDAENLGMNENMQQLRISTSLASATGFVIRLSAEFVSEPQTAEVEEHLTQIDTIVQKCSASCYPQKETREIYDHMDAIITLCQAQANYPEEAKLDLSRDKQPSLNSIASAAAAKAGVSLEEMASLPDPKMRLMVAIDEEAPAGVLETLASDAEPSVRKAVAKNASTPEALLQKLSEDEDSEVSETAKQNLAAR